MNLQFFRRVASVALFAFCLSDGLLFAMTVDNSPRPTILLVKSGRFIAQDAWNSAALYSFGDKKPIRRFTSSHEINTFQATADEQLLLIACENGALGIWNIETGKKLWWKTSSQSGLGYIYGASFSPDGKSMVACNEQAFAVICDSLTGKQMGKVSFPPGQTSIMSAALSPDGKTGAFVDLGERLFTFETATGLMEETGLTGASPVRYSVNGKYVALRSSNSGTDEQLRVVSIIGLNKKDVGQFSHIGHIKPTENGGFLVTALVGGSRRLWGYDDKCATVGLEYSPESGQIKEVWRLPVADAENRTDFDINLMIGLSTDYRLVTRLIDLRTGKPSLTIDNSANYRKRIMTYTSADLMGEKVQFRIIPLVVICVVVVLAWVFIRFGLHKLVG